MTISYENMTRHELEARLHFLVNHVEYLLKEAAKKDEKIEKLEEQNKEQKVEIDRLGELFKQAQERLFGKRSERIIVEAAGQLSFFDGIVCENEIIIEQPEKTQPVAAHTRRKKRTFEEIYSSLPSEVIPYALTDEEKVCTRCGGDMYMLPPDTRYEITHQPAVFEAHKLVIETCVCKHCRNMKDKDGKILPPVFAKAKAPAALIEGSYASPSLLASEIDKKFNMHLPITRIESSYKSMGFERSKQTICNNFLDCADILQPLYDVMHREFLKLKYAHGDETPGQVNHAKGKDKPVKGYFWVYLAGIYEKVRMVLYDHQLGRGSEHPKKFLKGFNGYFHCDAYAAYDSISGLILVRCFAHVRRRFLDAVKVQSDEDDLTTVAGQGLLMINEIFHIEGRDPKDPHKKSNYSPEEIAAIRKKYTSKMLKKFFEWCAKKNEEYLPSEKTREAISYALNQKEDLMRILDDPKLELTNNAAERAVRPVTVGRKNWLFCDSERGAHAAAVLYSIVNTAKMNGLKVYDYLNWVFERIRNCDFNKMADLVPWSTKIPEYVRIEGEKK